MAKPAVDISVLGAKELERALSKLPDKVQRTVVRSANRKVAKKVHSEVVRRAPVDTGTLKAAFQATNKPRLKTYPTAVVYYLDFPTRAQLGIPADTKAKKQGFYPLHLEYGFISRFGRTVPPHPYIRPAVDENIDVYHGMMRHDINKGIIRNMRRLAKK